MGNIFEDKDVRILRPCYTANVRILDLDDSVTPSEMASALALARCPLNCAREISPLKRVRVGQTLSKVYVLE